MASSLFDRLRQLDLPPQDYAIFGSGPLVVRHIIPSCHDLDVLCRREAWEIVKRRGALKYLPEYDVTVASLCDGAITFGTKWGIGNFDVNELIDTAEIIDSLPFVRLDHVVAYKIIRSSANDLLHLQALEASGIIAGRGSRDRLP
jgi:hypothetical protein